MDAKGCTHAESDEDDLEQTNRTCRLVSLGPHPGARADAVRRT